MSDTTRPVGACLSFEAYCEALGVDASDTRQASLVRALHAGLVESEKRFKASLDLAVLECQSHRTHSND